MSALQHLLFFGAATVVSVSEAAAESLRFSSIHGNNMILQAAPLSSTVWGYGGGRRVQVSIDGGPPVTAARSSWLGVDTWLARLPPQDAALGFHSLTATSGAERVTLTRVQFGDVYVCAGQSNMDYPLNAMTLPGKPGRVNCWDPANVNCTLLNDTTVEACARRRGVGCSQCHYGCVNNSQAEVNEMVHYDSLLRLNVIAESGAHFPTATKPLAEQKTTGWLPPSQMGGGFSAACWFYGRDLADTLQNHRAARPIGLLQAAVGGTSLQFWSSSAAIASCQGLSQPWQWPLNFRNGTGNLSTGYKLPDIPTGWNAKIFPMLRTVVKGAVWYQGESNTGVATPGGDARQYACGFQAMIQDWRRQWHNGTAGASDPEFAFGWIQLNSCNRAIAEESRTEPPVLLPTKWSYQNPAVVPGFADPLGEWKATTTSSSCTQGEPRGTPCKGQGDGFPSIRWAFTQSLELDNTFQAVIVDTPSAYGSVHSPFKQPVGSRLARAALAAIYHMKEFAASPMVKAVAATAAAVEVTLDGLGVDGRIEPPRAAAGFELLGNDGIWHSALVSATDIAGATIILPIPSGCVVPRAIRYIWYDTPCSNYPYMCPIYVSVPALGGLSGELDSLPLGPFIANISSTRTH